MHSVFFRAPVHDLDSSSSSVELDASFQRQLERQKEVTNKENSHPINGKKASSGLNIQRDSDRPMPLGEIVLDHGISEPIRNIPSWIIEDDYMYSMKDSVSFSDDRRSTNRHEYSEINRLLANCEINANESTMSSSLRIEERPVERTTETMATAVDNSVVIPEQQIKEEVSQLIGAGPDDTLEEIEYDKYGNGLRYVPVKKSIGNDSDDVILIESSPENSFVTARNHMGGRSMTTNADETFVTTNDMTHISGHSSNGNSTKSSAVGFYTINNTSAESSTVCSSKSDVTESVDAPTVQAREPSQHDSFDEMPEFDNTLDRIDYILEQGQRQQNARLPIMIDRDENRLPSDDSRSTAAQTMGNLLTVSPVIKISASASKATPSRSVATPGKSKATPGTSKLTPNTLKVTPKTTSGSANKKTPANGSQKKAGPSNSCGQFKKPEFRPSPSAGHLKVPGSCSKIPTLRPAQSAAMKLQYKHIASPVATYIKNTVEVPLLKTIRPGNVRYFDPGFNGRPKNGNLDITTQSKSSTTSSAATKKSTLPRKIFKTAAELQVNIQPFSLCFLTCHTTTILRNSGNFFLFADIGSPSNCDTRWRRCTTIDRQCATGH